MSTAQTQPQSVQSVREASLAIERVKLRKLEILFGSWWRHYAVPYEFRVTLYCENEHCHLWGHWTVRALAGWAMR